MYNVSFQGRGETTGSVAYRMNQKPTQPVEPNVQTCPHGNLDCPSCDTVSFHGKEYGEKKKKTSPWLIIGGVVAAAGLAVGGLGYLHKYAGKIGNKTIKGWVDKCEPVTKKCHEWCHSIKSTTTEWWNKIFKSKKS